MVSGSYKIAICHMYIVLCFALSVIRLVESKVHPECTAEGRWIVQECGDICLCRRGRLVDCTGCKITQQNNGTKEGRLHERCLVMLKPDAIQRGLIGKLIQRLEDKGLKLVAMKFMMAPEKLLRQHYRHVSKAYYPALIAYLGSSPVMPMVWEGVNAVDTIDKLLGANEPDAKPGTIRGDFSLHITRSVMHSSDNLNDAVREIKLWFQDSELVNWQPALATWVY